MNFLKKNIVNVLGSGLLGFVNLLISILLARYLGPAGVGQYQLVISTGAIVAILLSCGVGEALVYYINNKKRSKTEVATLSLKFSFVLSAVTILVLYKLFSYESYFGRIVLWALIAASISGSLLVMITVIWPILMADLQVVKSVVVQLLPRLILLVLVPILFLFGFFSINVAWTLTCIGQMAGLFATIWFLRKSFDLAASFNWNLMKSMVGYGLKINLAYVIRLLNGEVGLLCIRALLAGGFSQVGYYSRAMSLGAVLLFIASAVGSLLFAKWTRSGMTERRLQLESVTRVFLWISILGVSVIIPLAHRIITLLFGMEFLPAVPIMRILVIGIVARFMAMPHYRLFSSSGHPLFTSLVQGISLFVMVILMLLLVPKFMAEGGAVAFSLSNLVGLVVTYWLSCRKFDTRLSQCILLKKSDIEYIVSALRSN